MTEPLLLITRPEEEAARTRAAAQAAGFATLLAPLLMVEPLPWTLPGELPEALLFTSARAPGLAAAAAPLLRRLPAFAVGARTREMAEAAGFSVTAAGEGDGSAIFAIVAKAGVGSLLHLTGEASAGAIIPAGVLVDRRAIYRARPVDALPLEAATALADGRVFATMVFSARTAVQFTSLFDAAGLARETARLVALSPAVAAAAGPGWAAVAVASRPSLEEALAATRALWQGELHG